MQHSETTTLTADNVHEHLTMRWSAIFSGWLVATGIASLMYVAGLALGLTAFNPYNAEATAKGIATGTAIWIVLTWAVSLFLGGMFASWFDGRSDQTVGALHGITVWGLSLTVTGLLLAMGVNQVIQGGAATVRGGVPAAGLTAPQTITRDPSSGTTDEAITELQAQLTQRVAQIAPRNASTATAPTPSGIQATPPAATTVTAVGTQPSAQSNPAEMRRVADVDGQTMAIVARALLKGNTENAKGLLTTTTSMSQAEIDQMLQSLAPQIEKYKADAKGAADTAARYTAATMAIIFFSSLIALVAAGIGGWMGAGHIHRVHHLRRYQTTTR